MHVLAEQTYFETQMHSTLAAFDSDLLYEVVRGQRVESASMGAFECWLASRLFLVLGPFCEARKLGHTVAETLFLLDEATDHQRRPDLAFVSYERWPKNRRVPDANAWPVVPDLAIELISPSNTMPEVLAKVREYFQAGCRRVWVVLPSEEQIYVYDSPTETRILTKSDILEDEKVVPGFRMTLASLFGDGVAEDDNS